MRFKQHLQSRWTQLRPTLLAAILHHICIPVFTWESNNLWKPFALSHACWLLISNEEKLFSVFKILESVKFTRIMRKTLSSRWNSVCESILLYVFKQSSQHEQWKQITSHSRVTFHCIHSANNRRFLLYFHLLVRESTRDSPFWGAHPEIISTAISYFYFTYLDLLYLLISVYHAWVTFLRAHLEIIVTAISYFHFTYL